MAHNQEATRKTASAGDARGPYSNFFGSTLFAGGKLTKPGGGAARFLVGELCGLWLSTLLDFEGCCLHNAVGGGPISRDTVQGNSNLARPAH